MFSYTIAKAASKEEFARVCRLIESHFKEIDKDSVLEDVDGTAIQVYHKGGKCIKVYNDYEVDAVYVDSQMDLRDILVTALNAADGVYCAAPKDGG